MRQMEQRAKRARAVAVAQTQGDRGAACAALLALAGMSLIVASHVWPSAIALVRQVWPG